MSAVSAPDIGTHPPLPVTTTVAPFLVTRTCALPLRILDQTKASDVHGLIRSITEHRDRGAAIAPNLADAMYQLVPRLDGDDAARRALVNLRRDIFNNRSTNASKRNTRKVLPALDPGTRAMLEAWHSAHEVAATLTVEAIRLLEEHRKAAGKLLLEQLSQDHITPSLAMASTAFTSRLLGDRPGKTMAFGSRLGRTAFQYVARASVKPSPFSGLTTVGYLGQPSRTPDTPRHQSVFTSSRAVAVEVLQSLSRDPHWAGSLPVRVNAGITTVDGELFCILSQFTNLDGFFTRGDEVISVESYRDVLALLPRETTPLHKLGQLLGEEGNALALHLLRAGLLQPVTPWQPGDRDHIRQINQLVKSLPGPSHSAADNSFVRHAQELAGIEKELGHRPIPSARERIRLLERAATAAESLLAEVSPAGHPPHWLKETSVFHETVMATTPQPHVRRSDTGRTLARAARYLAPFLRISPLYASMVECFTASYGQGGVCTDVLSFLYRVALRTDPTTAFGPQARTNAEELQKRIGLSGLGTLASASATVFFQMADEPHGPPSADEDQVSGGLIVNSVQPGTAGVLSRWTENGIFGKDMADSLNDWTSSLHPGCSVLQFSAFADWSEMQRPTLGPNRVLRWPSDIPSVGEGQVELSRLSLRHDPASGTLQLIGPDSEHIATHYVGTVPSLLLKGPVGMLILLSNPWVITGRVDREYRFSDISRSTTQPNALPRIEEHGIVWARARWRMHRSDVPSPRKDEIDLDFLLRVEQWRNQHNLPNEIYVAQVAHTGMGLRRKKPQWLHFAHPYSIWSALAHIDEDCVEVDFSEALPSIDASLRRGVTGDTQVQEMVGLMRFA